MFHKENGETGENGLEERISFTAEGAELAEGFAAKLRLTGTDTFSSVAVLGVLGDPGSEPGCSSPFSPFSL